MSLTAAEAAAKLAKHEVNLGLFDQVVNGDVDTLVPTDNGLVPSLAKVAAEAGWDVAIAAAQASIVANVTAAAGSATTAVAAATQTVEALSTVSQRTPSGSFDQAGFINSNGSYSPTTDWRSTDFVPVESGVSYTVSAATAGNAWHVWYDADRLPISAFRGGSGGVITVSEHVSPIDARFARLCCLFTGITSAYFESSSARLNLDLFQSALANHPEFVSPAVEMAEAAAVRSEAARDVAVAGLDGPFHDSEALGLAATSEGDDFLVNPPGTGLVSGFKKVAGAAVNRFAMATTALLASIDGALHIGFGWSDGPLISLKQRLLQSVTPLDYAAVGNGIAGDREPLRKAMQRAMDSGIPFKGRGRTYRIESGSNMLLISSTRSAIDMDWEGATVIVENNGVEIRGASGTPYLTTGLASNAVRGDAKVTLTSVTGIEVGDLLEITNPAPFTGAIPATHYYPVNSVVGSDVYIDGVVVADINPQQLIDAQVTEPSLTGSIVVRAYKLGKMITMRNLTTNVVDPDGNAVAFLLRFFYTIVTDNTPFRGHTRGHIILRENVHTFSNRAICVDHGFVEGDEGYASEPSDPDGLGFGYGLGLYRNCFSVVTNSFGGNGWHFVDVGVGQMNTVFDTITFTRNGYGMQSHGGAWRVTYQNIQGEGTSGISCGAIAHVDMDHITLNHTRLDGIDHGQHISFTMNNVRVLMDNAAYTKSAIKQSHLSTHLKHGARSASDVIKYVYRAVTVNGRANVQLGGPLVAGYESELTVQSGDFADAAVGIAHQRRNVVTGNTFNGTLQYAISVTGTSNADYTNISKNEFHGGNLTGTPAAIRLQQASTKTIIAYNNNDHARFIALAPGVNITRLAYNVHEGTSFQTDGNATNTVKSSSHNSRVGPTDWAANPAGRVVYSQTANETVLIA